MHIETGNQIDVLFGVLVILFLVLLQHIIHTAMPTFILKFVSTVFVEIVFQWEAISLNAIPASCVSTVAVFALQISHGTFHKLFYGRALQL